MDCDWSIYAIKQQFAILHKSNIYLDSNPCKWRIITYFSQESYKLKPISLSKLWIRIRNTRIRTQNFNVDYENWQHFSYREASSTTCNSVVFYATYSKFMLCGGHLKWLDPHPVCGSGSGHKSVKFYLLNVKPHNGLTDLKFKFRNPLKCNKTL